MEAGPVPGSEREKNAQKNIDLLGKTHVWDH